ncbi:MAG: ATP-binding cassette domain-containing protein, partial [Actinobacteria bacterium]|nr:ATP-binding cassette domain-containing protein [Actinomycetota bacterium]
QEASNGAIFIDGQDITHAPPHENALRGIVMVPGGRGVFPTLTVAENLASAADAARLDDATATARIAEVYELFPSLAERARTAAGNLSGGEQQMLALGQAFLSRPRLLMIDELSLGLAPALVEQLIGTVRRINAAGTTVILVEQSINVALTIAERAIFMEKGEIRFDGPVAELLGRPDLVRAVFMGGALGGARTHWSKKAERRDEALRAEDVVVRYGGVDALRGASISVARGEIVGIIGPNGAGKTTLFDAITGHARADRGTIVLEGADVTSLPPDARARRGLGRSFQDARLFGSLTVRECIALAFESKLKVRNPLFAALRLPNARAEEARVRRRVDSLVYLFGLQSYADKFVHELSTGTRRAVDVACITAAEPDVVLLDEPSSGLAQAEAETLAPLMLRLVHETGCGMLVIEHDLPLISSIADRLVVMDLGTVLAEGRPDEVLSDPLVIEAYLAATDEVIQRSDLRKVRSARAELV